MSTDPDIATAARALLEALDAHEDVAGPDAFAVYSLAAADAVFDAKSALRDAIAADAGAVARLRGYDEMRRELDKKDARTT